jgi:hypothetical protein
MNKDQMTAEEFDKLSDAEKEAWSKPYNRKVTRRAAAIFRLEGNVTKERVERERDIVSTAKAKRRLKNKLARKARKANR